MESLSHLVHSEISLKWFQCIDEWVRRYMRYRNTCMSSYMSHLSYANPKFFSVQNSRSMRSSCNPSCKALWTGFQLNNIRKRWLALIGVEQVKLGKINSIRIADTPACREIGTRPEAECDTGRDRCDCQTLRLHSPIIHSLQSRIIRSSHSRTIRSIQYSGGPICWPTAEHEAGGIVGKKNPTRRNTAGWSEDRRGPWPPIVVYRSPSIAEMLWGTWTKVFPENFVASGELIPNRRRFWDRKIKTPRSKQKWENQMSINLNSLKVNDTTNTNTIW